MNNTIRVFFRIMLTAFTLMGSLSTEAWAMGKPINDIHKSAAIGYAKYQKPPLHNAERLLGVENPVTVRKKRWIS